MVSNIESIVLWTDNPQNYNDLPIVKVIFKFPCKWTTFELEDLKDILRQWIIGEEVKYPLNKGFKGREMLLIELLSVFNERLEK